MRRILISLFVLILLFAARPPISRAELPQPDMFWVTVGATLLLGMLQDECREPEPIDYAISVIPQSLYFTHREVSRPWESTGRIIITSDYEGVRVPPNLGDLDSYISVKKVLDNQLLLCLPEPYGRALIVGKSIFQFIWTAQDNRFREALGHGTVWGVSFTVHF